MAAALPQFFGAARHPYIEVSELNTQRPTMTIDIYLNTMTSSFRGGTQI